MEEALRQYFDNKATDWVCSYDEQVSLTRNEIISFVEEIIAEQECVYGWSVKAGWEVQTLPQLLPSVEMGTTQLNATHA